MFARHGFRRRSRSHAALGLLLTFALILGAHGASADPQGGSSAPNEAASAPIEEPVEVLDLRNEQPDPAVLDELASTADRDGFARVIVGLKMLFKAEGSLGPVEAATQQATIKTKQTAVLADLAGTWHEVAHLYDYVPYLALRVGAPAVDALRRSPNVSRVQVDSLGTTALDSTIPIVEANETSQLRRKGTGRVVAVLDTGVLKNHAFLNGKVVDEACYSASASCPGGVTNSTAVGSGAPCTLHANCDHGTHVAGIAAGRPYSGVTRQGVAPGANIMSIMIFGTYTGCSSVCYTDSDLIKGLERVYARRTAFGIASVNLSIQGSLFTNACDSSAVKAPIDNLRSAGIATVIAAGNAGSSTQVSHPGCISTAVTVGATQDNDVPASFSNSNSLVDLWAPGAPVNSSVSWSSFPTICTTCFGNKNGTSMAAPHVAGAFAVLEGLSTSMSVFTIQSHFTATGKPITDSRNNITRDRIRVLAASVRVYDTGFRDAYTAHLAGGGIVSNGRGLATRGGGTSGNISISGIPAGATVRTAYLYWMTLGEPDATVTFAGSSRTGELVGASRNTCWTTNNPNNGATRTYRADVTGAVAGNGSYAISGVSPTNGDGNGASLVVVYSQPTGTVTHMHIRDGAMTAETTGETMTHYFVDLVVPKTPSNVRVHYGIADGQSGLSESNMKVGTYNITPTDFMTGTDGPFWDDNNRFVSSNALPVDAFSVSNSLQSNGDCLSWAYAALRYQA